MEELPIYDFNNLKKLLESKGVVVGEVTGPYKVNNGTDVTFEDLGKSIHFSNEGVIYTDDEGISQVGFLYKK